MRYPFAILALTMSLLVSCSGMAFDPAQANAEIPNFELDANQEPVVLAEGKLYWHGRPFSGWMVKRFENNQTDRREGYLTGKRHGTAEFWYANGQMRERRTYRDGRKEGRHEGWWEDGKRRFDHEFQEGKHHGRARNWSPEGMLIRDFNYENGHENGAQRMWKANGRIQANYEVYNGRRYGYIGTKNCVSVSDNFAKPNRNADN